MKPPSQNAGIKTFGTVSILAPIDRTREEPETLCVFIEISKDRKSAAYAREFAENELMERKEAETETAKPKL